MSIKIIAIGNVLMEDDGIAIFVIENIRKELEEKNIEVVVGETDFNYCISLIDEEDFVVIIDSASFNGIPGETKIYDIDNCNSLKKGYTQHSYGLLDLMGLYFKNIKGYVIGIQVSSVNFNLGISFALEGKFEEICNNTKDIISKLILNQV